MTLFGNIIIAFMLIAGAGAFWVGLVEMFYSACVEDNDRWLAVDLYKLVRRVTR